MKELEFKEYSDSEINKHKLKLPVIFQNISLKNNCFVDKEQDKLTFSSCSFYKTNWFLVHEFHKPISRCL